MPGESLSRQYHYWPAGQAYDAWRVTRLMRLAEGLPLAGAGAPDRDRTDRSRG